MDPPIKPMPGAWFFTLFVIGAMVALNVYEFSRNSRNQPTSRQAAVISNIEFRLKQDFVESGPALGQKFDPWKSLEELNALTGPARPLASRLGLVIEHEYKLYGPSAAYWQLIQEKGKNAEAWRKLYSKSALTSVDEAEIKKEIARTDLGWSRVLARAHLDERVGKDPHRDRIKNKALAGLSISALVILTILLAALVGLVFWLLRLKHGAAAAIDPRPVLNRPPWAYDGLAAAAGIYILVIALIPSPRTADQVWYLPTNLLIGVWLALAWMHRGIQQAGGESPLRFHGERALPEALSGYCRFAALLFPLFALSIWITLDLPQPKSAISDVDLLSMPWAKATALFLTASIVAPITEEIVFRAGLFVALWQRTGRPYLSAWITGFAFAIIHPQFIGGLLGVTALAVIMALAYARTRSLAAPILIHAINNGLITLLAA